MNMKSKRIVLGVSAVLVAALVACGGGGGGTPSSNPPMGGVSTLVTLTGTVVGDMAIKNAVVCLDLNKNQACEANEPVSAKTGADGVYSLQYDSAVVSAVQIAGASLVAFMVPGALTDPNTTIDMANPAVGNAFRPYAQRGVAGKSGQINPLTTLVQKGIDDGMTESVARANVALQLNIADVKINDYQSDPVFSYASPDTARAMAKLTQATLDDGGVLIVGDQTAAIVSTPGDLAGLRYTDAASYGYRNFNRTAKAAGVAGSDVTDIRSGATAGTATAHNVLYNIAYLSPPGWTLCDETVPIKTTLGNPSRSNFCKASDAAGYAVETDIASQSMATVVNTMQTDGASNVINNGLPVANLITALGTANFPAASLTRKRTSLNLNQPIYINSINTDGRPQAEATTLAQLITAKPSSGVNLATATGSLGLGLSTSSAKNLRFAFTGTTSATAGTVQYYDCDLSATNVVSNCVNTVTGTYSIDTVNGVSVMRFAGFPETIMNHTRVYVEVSNAPTVIGGDWVFQARENKPTEAGSVTVANRLNATAWDAMKTTLGLQ